jgi:hypothetical protein
LLDYLRVGPLLIATSLWGRLVPQHLRLMRERKLNQRRLNRLAGK